MIFQSLSPWEQERGILWVPVLQGLTLEIKSILVVRQWRYTVLLTTLMNASPLGGVRGQMLGASVSFWEAGGKGCRGGGPCAPA